LENPTKCPICVKKLAEKQVHCKQVQAFYEEQKKKLAEFCVARSGTGNRAAPKRKKVGRILLASRRCETNLRVFEKEIYTRSMPVSYSLEVQNE